MTPEPDNVVILPAVADDPVFQESIPVPGDFATPEPVRAPRQLGSDPHDFAALYMRHRWSFALHARRFLSDQRDIDEVLQEGFLKLFLALPELENELQALAYARRTITNLCIDRYRADQRRPRLVDLEALTPEVLAEDEEIDPVVAAEDAALVREALSLLSPLHREALVKREVEEKPLPQIAAELDIPVEQVKHVLHRARAALRRLLVGTAVEPGVDLDLAAVLAANRARAAAAAKPTGAAALVLLLTLAGVLGLRASHDRGDVVGAVPTAGPGTLDPGPQAGGDGTVAPQPVPPSAPTAADRPHTASRGPAVVGRSPAPAASSAGAATAGSPAASPAGGSTGVTTVRPPVVPPAAAPQQPAAELYVLRGITGAQGVHVIDQQRDARPASAVSLSTLRAQTPHGTYQVAQTVTFDETGAFDGITLNESIPLPTGDSVGTSVGTSASQASTQPDGSVAISATGLAVAVGQVNGQTAPIRRLTLSLVLAPDRVQVLSEQLVVSGAVPGELPTTGAGSSAPSSVPPAPAPAVDPAPGPGSPQTSAAPASPVPPATASPDPTTGAPEEPVVVEGPAPS